MTHVYAPVYQAVKTAQILDDADLDGADFVQAQMKLAVLAHDAYERMRTASRGTRASDGLGAKEAMVVGVVETALALHEAHGDSGAKTAALPEHLADVVAKLAAAVMVDEVLLEQLPMLEGTSKLAAESAQLLGREYIMSLIGEVLK